ncbi:hypothetical protein TrVGV298_000198 [Trichoderma virens]|nr:hypothetical protein TrVGV298_000198 [Trichoderma virens]
MANPNDPPLDEIQWRSPQIVAQMGGLHSNTILFYFAESPFFERTSNNAVIMAQAMNNMAMYHYIQTREAFETRLKTMSGLEFIVDEAERYQDDDEITVHASFFVVGENIYMAPTLADILASRIMTISSAIAKALPAAEAARKWRPSTGHVYQLPASQPSTQPKPQEPKEENPALDDTGKPVSAVAKHEAPFIDRVAEESFMIHLRYGGEYIDENPITGKPGEFHLSSTGRKPVLPPQGAAPTGISAMSGPPMLNTKLDDKKDGRADKTPKSATMPKLKRKKSKMSPSVTPAATPGAS